MGLTLGPIILYAVHDEDFQLDGDVLAATDAFPFPGITRHVDWDSIFDANGNSKLPDPPVSATGFRHAAFTRDFGLNANNTFNTLDDTTYTTGSKDTLPITGGWDCTVSNNVNSKTDIINAYTVDYIDPATNQKILYFGMERNVNTGDANIAFWFLQGEANCESPGGTTHWTGHHTNGDLLIVSAFTKGGKVSGIDAYAWQCPAGSTPAQCDANGSLNTVSVAPGFDCRSSQAFNGHDPIPAGDKSCAVSNLGGISGIPWLTVKKTTVGHALDTAEFYEGGINLTLSGFGDKCFNTFVGDTRSSQELGATIFDYARGELGECASTTTTMQNQANPVSIGTGTVPNVHDSATITVEGISSFNGTVQFYLCGPSANVITGPCDDGTTQGHNTGVKIGAAQSVTANSTKVSNDVTLTSVGNYCWGAVFSGDPDAGVPGSQDNGTNECFTVSPVKPDIVTTAGPDVDFGQAVTDTATLTKLATQPGTNGLTGAPSINATNGAAAGGKITFTLYGPGNVCGSSPPGQNDVKATGTGTNPQDVSVSGNGTYPGSGSVSFTPDSAGTFHWVVQYFPAANDPNNQGNTHNTTCTDTDEDVVVSQIPTKIMSKQNWIPNDQATVTSGNSNKALPAGGTVVFKLINNATCNAGANDANVLYKETKVPAGSTLPALTEEFSTTNTGTGGPDSGHPLGMFKINSGYADTPTGATASKGPFSWSVVYTPPTGSAFLGRQSSCATVESSEYFSINYHNDAGDGQQP